VKGSFANMFSYFVPCKNIYLSKVLFEMCVLKCVEILGKVVKIRVFM
jgi:hypothetical protein